MEDTTSYGLWVNSDETEWHLSTYRSAEETVKDTDGQPMSLFALFKAPSWEEAIATKERLMEAHWNNDQKGE